MSHEITLSGDINDRISWLGGVFYQEEDGFEQVQVRYPLAPPNATSAFQPISNYSDRFIDNTSTAVYGQISADLTDKLELTLGARQTEETKEVLVNSRAFRNAADMTDETVTVFTAPEREASETNFLANLSYDVTDDAMVYAQYSDGFRNGGFPARAPNGTTPADFLNLAYDEEFVTSYEAGFKSTLLDGALRINAAAFLMDFEDYQVNANAFIEALDGVFGSIANVGDAEIKGVEAEGSFLATDNLRFDFSVGFLDTELTSINEDPNTGLRQFILGNGSNVQKTITEDLGVELPHAPKLQLNLGANYSFFLGNGAEIRNRADVFYESRQFSSIGNYITEIIPETTRVNYNATYLPENANWEITLGARNLLDAEDITNAVNETSPRSGRYNVLARGREGYIQFKYNFGE